jgi:hypothetical protein
MASDKKLTGDYDKNGDFEDDVEAASAPAPGTAPHGIPAGLPPESYMTAQEAHVAGGGEYAPPEEEAAPEADAAKARKEGKK